MARTSIIMNHTVAAALNLPTGMTGRGAISRVLNLIHGCIAGAYAGASGFSVSQAQATGTLTLSSASGSVGGIINGVTITVTASGGDAATATALAAAINASVDPLVQHLVRADNLDANGAATAVVTVTAHTPGVAGNTVTLAATGTGVTASGARLTGATSTHYFF
jgi:trimeric autotransporter adhesin